MKRITIDELRQRYRDAVRYPKAFFGSDIEAVLEQTLRLAHPDLFDPKHRDEADELFRKFTSLADAMRKPEVVVKGKVDNYSLSPLIYKVGDVADVYRAFGSGKVIDALVKISRITGAADLLLNEYNNLTKLRSAGKGLTYEKYLPSFVETVAMKRGQRANVFLTPDQRWLTLAQLKWIYPSGLPTKHLVWIYRRLLTILSFTHSQGIVHKAVLPENVIVFPANHGLQLLDWNLSSTSDPATVISESYRQWYPPEVLAKETVGPTADVFMATQIMIWLAGGDPIRRVVPSTIPSMLSGFFRAALIALPRLRPEHGFKFLDDFTAASKAIYGGTGFVELDVPALVDY